MKTKLDAPDKLMRETVFDTDAQMALTAAGLPLVAPSANAPASHMKPADLFAMEQQAQTQEDAQRTGRLG